MPDDDPAALRAELAALEGEIAGLRVELGFDAPAAAPSARRTLGAPPAHPSPTPSMHPPEGGGKGGEASLRRTFSSNTYAKMLANPRLTPQQREKIAGMKERREAKEVALESSMTDLVRQASPATHAALRDAMSGLEEARTAAGFGPSSATPPLLVPAPGSTMTDLVRTGSEALHDALADTMSGLAEAKKAAGFGSSAP